MREDTFEKRLDDLRRRRAFPHARKSGDPINHPRVLEDLQTLMRVKIGWMAGNDDPHLEKTYAATRYYSISVKPDEESILDEHRQWMIIEITRQDFNKWGSLTFPEQNQYLERLWFRHGGS